MATNYTNLELIGDTTINLQDGTNWALVENGYVPRIAQRRRNVIGGQSPFEDVTETITVDLFATSAATMYAQLKLLNDTIDQARKWGHGQNVTPIWIGASPQGVSAASWLSAIVDGEVILPADWVDQLLLLSINNIRINITRRGVWMRENEYNSATISASINTRVNTTITGATFESYCPLRLQVYGNKYDAGNNYNFGTVITANDTTRIKITAGSTWSSGVNAATSGGSVVLTATATYATAWIPVVSGFNVDSKRVAIFLDISTQSFAVFPIRLAFGDGNLVFPQRQIVFYPDTTAGQNIQMVGVVEWDTDITHAYISIDTPGTNRVLTVHKITLVDVDDVNTHIVGLTDYYVGNYTSTPPSNGGSELRITNTPLTQIAPNVDLLAAGGANRPHVGDAWLTTNGTLVYAHLAVDSSASTPTMRGSTFESSLILK